MTIVYEPRRQRNGADLRILPYDDGIYLVQPLVDRVDDLRQPLKNLGLEWDPCAWGFWCPADRLGSLHRFCFIHGLRTRRTP